MSSIQVYKSNGHKYVRIIESYRVPGHKNPKVRVLKNLGREDELEAKEPGIVERLKREHNASRAADAAVKQDYFVEEIRSLLQSEDNSATEGFPLVNYGVEVYEKLWNELKLDYFFDYRQKQHSRIQFKVKDMVSLLVYSRLLNPGSKKRTFENRHWLAPEGADAGLEKIYRTLPFLADQKENLEKHLNKQLSAGMDRDLSVAFYDVTTYYFESVRADDLKRFGYSKDNKVNQVQVVMGLLIDSNGIPISYELFPGNTNDFKTLEPVMRKLKSDYGINKVIITADRGLNSKQNLAFLKSMGYEYVMAYKIRSSSKDIKEMVLNGETYHTVSKEFKWKVCNFSTSVNYDGHKVNLDDQMVITWSASREAKDRRDRERLIEKSKKLVESKSALKSEMKKGGKKYVQLNFIEEDQVAFNHKQLANDELYDGYYGIQFSDETLDPSRVIDIYHGLWKIEESFRVMKSNLEARPIFVWTEESIKGHFVLCYLALVIQRYLEYLLKKQGIDLSTEVIQDAVKSAQYTLISADDAKDTYYIKNMEHESYRDIIKVLEISEKRQYGKL